ncbi:MAG: hypothetical protein LBB22_01920 [Treponema sp.]|jgi:hypothetical protein|nr:hypothetical protein [Treponema sp.]
MCGRIIIKVRLKVIGFLFAVFAVSCTIPAPQQTAGESGNAPEAAAVESAVAQETENIQDVNGEEAEANFDPANVTPELYQETKDDVANFIQDLNIIIKSKSYELWRAYLDDNYYSYICSPEYLQRVSSAGILLAKGIVLSDAHDYFMYVVVPSRSNDRVDDIEFVGKNRVKAITLNKGRRLLLYDLEKTQDGWKILIPNSKNS